jgi:hypothetical protein
MFERPILIYSDFCKFSKDFLNTLSTNQELSNTFILLNIDADPQTRQRPQAFYQVQEALGYKISEVPTIIVGNGEYVLTGQEAFKWLDFASRQPNQHRQDEKVSTAPFNPNEMLGFSDGYSPLDSSESASPQSFKFVGMPDEPFPIAQELGAIGQDDYNQKMKERDRLDIPPNPMGPRQAIQSGLGPRPNASTKGGSSKEKGLDARLQKLLTDRESSVPPPPRPDPRQVRFSAT